MVRNFFITVCCVAASVIVFCAKPADAQSSTEPMINTIHELYEMIKKDRKNASMTAAARAAHLYSIYAAEAKSFKGYFDAMQQQQSEADMYLKNKEYYRAWLRYNNAKIDMPSALLFFKAADAHVLHMIYTKVSAPMPALVDYDEGLAFYQLEPENKKSVSQACLKKMKTKIECLNVLNEEYYAAYKKNNNAQLPFEKAQHCIDMEPNIFAYQSYCQ